MSIVVPELRVAIGIATRERPDILTETLDDLSRQLRLPDRIVVSCVGEIDVARVAVGPKVEVLMGPAGSCHQRNTILDALMDCDIVLFLDDDFLMAPGYIEATLAAFEADPAVVVTTGRVLADGARGPGICMFEAREVLAHKTHASPREPATTPIFNGYGCNMAIRLEVARIHGIRFDERLPLYAWYEDLDFTRRLGRHGKIVRVENALGVHLGTKVGRTTGCRLGYSQVANPLYLWRKGSYPLDHALRSIGRHLLANGVRSLRPESWVDRRGRLRGNAMAVLDVLRGRVTPERVLDL